MSKIRVLIADDHAIVRKGLIALLESDGSVAVVAEADDGEAALAHVAETRPDLVVMDILMPVRDGISATREIKDRYPGTKVLVLTTSTVSDDLAAALSAGADGAITKATAVDTLLAAVKSVAAGERVVSPEISRLIANDPPARELTERQREILAAMARGRSNKEIADELGIQTDSVGQHVMAIRAKLGAANRTEAVAIALRKQLLKG